MSNAVHFFLGANSGHGFQSLFDRFCSSDDHYDLLILKGGPGAGKSTMMRKIGVAMEERGEQVEYLHCSGDPDSLDGVHIPRIKTAVIDGTAPHVVEPKYPAAVDRYVNLGAFYDIASAKTAREEIKHWSDACSDGYRSAYRVLGAAQKLSDDASQLMLRGLDQKKLARRTEGIIGREIRGKGSGGRDSYRFLGSYTYKGPVWRFDSVEKLSDRVYHLIDTFGVSAMMLRQIHTAAQKKQYASIICCDPENTERIHHLLIPELGLAFITVREGMECTSSAYRRIHLDAMINGDHYIHWKSRIKFSKKMVSTLRDEGIRLLAEAKAAHDALEGQYLPNVDFAGIDELTLREIERISSYK